MSIDADYFTGTGNCGHSICYDDDGHSDGCQFDAADLDAVPMAYVRDSDALDAIAALYRRPEWKVDGSAASFIEAVASELRVVRDIDSTADALGARPRD